MDDIKTRPRPTEAAAPFPLPGAPDLAEAAQAFARLCQTIAALRDQNHGCPWDREQDHASLRRYMLEEAYEAVEVMAGEAYAPAALCDELGDVLLQVVLNAQIALDHKDFSIVDVVAGLDAKMRRRHPHVFGSAEERQARDRKSLSQSWQAIKQQERAGSSAEAAAAQQKNPFDEGKVKNVHPATSQALKIGKIAAQIRFDWNGVDEVWQKFLSEVDELRVELDAREAAGGGHANAAAVTNELGDLYFTLGQLCRHLGLDPELTALQGNQKFLRRFASLVGLADQKNIKLTTASQAELEGLWLEAKKREASKA